MLIVRVRVLVFNATFNNISAIFSFIHGGNWRNHQPVCSLVNRLENIVIKNKTFQIKMFSVDGCYVYVATLLYDQRQPSMDNFNKNKNVIMLAYKINKN
jgi:hypothetical protein